MSAPRVSAVIPHHDGLALLRECLDSLAQSGELDLEIVVVDDASQDGCVVALARSHPAVRCLSTGHNLGYAGACNRGAAACRGRYLLLLNDDTVHAPGWLVPLVALLEQRPEVAAVQPKILEYADRSRFDHAGAAGGHLDAFGFPFARGRIFGHRERDEGQYDDATEVFWGSGAALLVRRSAFEEVGGFDADFFAHMDEIDLCWRLQRTGHRVWVEPASVVHHRGAATLPRGSFRKHYLNHRNSIWMLAANAPSAQLPVRLAGRMLLELAALLRSLVTGSLREAAAIAAALGWLALHPGRVVAKRRRVDALPRPGAADAWRRVHPGSIAVSYFLAGRRRYSDLAGPPPDASTRRTR